MNNILVLAKNKETHFIKRLTEEVGKESISFYDPFIQSEGRVFSDLILCRTTSIYGGDEDLNFLRSQSARIINPLKALETFRTKPTQYQFFSKCGISHLPWLNLLQTNEASLKEFISRSKAQKFLIKPHRGLGGWGIQVFSPTELLHWFNEAQDLEFLVQPYLQDVKELRYFFVKDGWSITLERLSSGGAVAANFRQEGSARVVDTPDFLPGIIQRAASSVSMDFGAMDVLVSDQGSYVLEINLVPGIEQLEEVTGENVMGKLITIF